MVFLALCASFCGLAVGYSLCANAQSVDTDAEQVAASTAQNLIRWAGTLPQAAGRTVEVSFGVYENPSGGIALWSETQKVKVGVDGRYSVLLGATSAEGLPQALFPAGGARWIEARLEDGQQVDAAGNVVAAPRSLLAEVPYAFKAMDAETLAGRAATDYLTREDLNSTVADQVQAISNISRILPISGTLPATGTAGYLPVWTAPATLGTSIIAENGTGVGIGTNTPVTMLDVNGASTLRAAVTFLASAATVGAGVNSPALQLEASTYSSASNAPEPQTFVWQAQSAGNNTSNPVANLALLFGSGTAVPEPTGLSIAPNGQITFAAGQTFPGASTSAGEGSTTSPLTGVTAGAGLTGGGSSGNVTLALSGPISTTNGGTGATTPAAGLANLGGISSVQITAQSMAGPLNSPSINDELYANQFSGADIGAKINAALASCPADSKGYQQCTIHLPRANRATWSTSVLVTSPGVSIVGEGSYASVFTCTVNGDCLRIYTNPFTVQQAGDFRGFALYAPSTPTINGVGIHAGEIVGAHFDDLEIFGFNGANGAALWLDNAHAGTPGVGTWTERNVFTKVHLANSTKLLRFTVEAGNDSFGYNRMLDVRLNPTAPGTTYGVSLENKANVYNGTYRFTINNSGKGDSVFHLQDTARWTYNEFHIYGEDQGTMEYLWDICSTCAVSYYGEVKWNETNLPSRVLGSLAPLGSSVFMAQTSISNDGDVVIAAGSGIYGMFSVFWSSNNRVDSMMLAVGANQFSKTSSINVLSKLAYQGQAVISDPRVVLDSNSWPQLVVAVGNRNGAGTLYVTQYTVAPPGTYLAGPVTLLPLVAEGTTSTTNISSTTSAYVGESSAVIADKSLKVDAAGSAAMTSESRGIANRIVCWKTATTLGVCSTPSNADESCICK